MLSSASPVPPSLKVETATPPLWHDTQSAWLDPIKSEQTTSTVDAAFFPPTEWSTDVVPSSGQASTDLKPTPPIVTTQPSETGPPIEGTVAMQSQTSSPTELFHRVPLGEKGRMELKSAIRAAIKERPELRERVNAVAKLRCATIPQLLKIASICNLWTMALNISRRFMETRNGKQSRSSRRDASAIVSPDATDLRRVRPNSKIRRPTMALHEGQASPSLTSCPVPSPAVAGQSGEWDAGACWTAYDAVQSWISTPSWVSSVPYSLADLGGTAAPPPGPEPATSSELAFPAWNMTSY